RLVLADHLVDRAHPEQRLPLAMSVTQLAVELGFLGAIDDPAGPGARPEVQVRVAGRWVGLVGPYGAAWLQKATDLAVTPLAIRPNG
ncbi:hypothetical protein ABZU46_21975, partial [Micromonospora sp. NPDC005197]